MRLALVPALNDAVPFPDVEFPLKDFLVALPKH